ncbi:uncharacterized protein I206_103364 [Kwoniella pini CBS 10737]|uniref:Uncharacterized protein n=1 Tax=Kwoniella pini CBS 10737 TaxID=1296096 RepID=A0AAJ8L5V3_9TREE
MSEKPLYTIPIDERPPHGPWTSKVFFPLVFNFAQLGINSAQFLFVPLLLIPVVGRRWFDTAVGWTKDGYGRLCELHCKRIVLIGSDRDNRTLWSDFSDLDNRYTTFNN